MSSTLHPSPPESPIPFRINTDPHRDSGSLPSFLNGPPSNTATTSMRAAPAVAPTTPRLIEVIGQRMSTVGQVCWIMAIFASAVLGLLSGLAGNVLGMLAAGFVFCYGIDAATRY